MVSPLASGATGDLSSLLGAGNSGVSPQVLARVSRTLQAQNALAPKLNAAISSDKTKLSGLGQLQSALGSLQDVLKSLSGEGLTTNASSSAGKVLSASSSASAKSGTYQIQVNQLAQGQVLQSKLVKSADTALAADNIPTSIKLELGTAGNGSFQPNAQAGKPVTLLINPANSSLQGIATAINDAKLGVTAKVNQVAGNFNLSLTTPSGSENTLRISVTGDANLQKLLAYNPAGAKNLSESSSAQNALLKVNGRDVVSQTNTVTNAVEGTSLKLAAKGTADVVIARDNQQISKNVNNLVNTFNNLNARLRSLQQNELKNERVPNLVQDQLARVLRNTSSIASDGSTLTLEKIGITTQRNGDLALDENKLSQVLATDPAAVAQLFTNSRSGLTEALNSQVKNLTGEGGGIAREVANTNKNLASLNQKKENLAKALTIQANMLVRQYSQQSNALPGLPETTPTRPGSLFDALG